jgi:phosphoribosylanthranilate isomerase
MTGSRAADAMAPNAPPGGDARPTVQTRPLCVKVCGLTRAVDVEAAIDAGADLLGFNFYPSSPRYVSIETAAPLIRMLPRRVLAVGIFVDPTADDVRRAIDAGVRLLQFHGEEHAEFCGGFDVPAMKALRVRRLADLPAAARAYPDEWLLLADTADERLRGGTGRALAPEPIDPALARRLFLAGGLTPESVADAVRALRPLGVDVCSGVEERPGRKSHALLRAFVSHAKAA